MEISKKDLAEVGQAVENLGRLVEQQLESIHQKLNHLSQYSAEAINELKSLQNRLNSLEAEIEEVKEKGEDLALLKQELSGMARNSEKILADLQELIFKFERPAQE